MAVPLARPAILGGVALALMEALADFGTVNLLGVPTFTDAIYRVWFLGFDRDAAMQLGTLLVSVTLTLLALERLARGRARYHQTAAPRGGRSSRCGCAAPPRPRRCWARWRSWAWWWPRRSRSSRVWAVESVSDDLLPAQFAAALRNSLLLAFGSALVVAAVATLLGYGLRAARSQDQRRRGPGGHDRLRAARARW